MCAKPISEFSLTHLRQRKKRRLARARCAQCASAAQRCSTYLQKRALNSIRLKCAGSGLCGCALGATTLQQVAQLGDTFRIEHSVDSWRHKECPGVPGQPDSKHAFFRDIGSAAAIGMLAHIEFEHNGRPAAFCHR